MAEKLLEPEPCGSFLVRDSSDEHYIFSLSFKLDEMVRHVRIEQEQGLKQKNDNFFHTYNVSLYVIRQF